MLQMLQFMYLLDKLKPFEQKEHFPKKSKIGQNGI